MRNKRNTENKIKNNGLSLGLKCLLAALPLILFAVVLAVWPMRIFDKEYPMWQWQKDTLTDETVQADVVFLGDSLMQSGVMPTLWGDGALSLALGGASSIEMRYSLETYLEYHDTPKLVIMGYGQNHYMELSSFWERNAYFHYMPLLEQAKVLRRAAELDDLSLFETDSPYADMLAYACYSPKEYLPAYFGMMEERGRLKLNLEWYAYTGEMRGYHLNGTQESNGLATDSVMYEEFIVSPLLDEQIREILTICSENGIQVVIERPPLNLASEQAMHEAFAAQYVEYLNQLAADYPGIIVNTVIEVYPDDCFGDHEHLNARGAERYTQSLILRYAQLIGG